MNQPPIQKPLGQTHQMSSDLCRHCVCLDEGSVQSFAADHRAAALEHAGVIDVGCGV